MCVWGLCTFVVDDTIKSTQSTLCYMTLEDALLLWVPTATNV